MQKVIPPSVRETAFNCPHCSVLTTQHWYAAYARKTSDSQALPTVWKAQNVEWLRTAIEQEKDAETAKRLRQMLELGQRLMLGAPELGANTQDLYVYNLENVAVSLCYNCKKASLWIHDRLVFPDHIHAPPPNVDTPDQVRRVYEEAGSIVHQSPRGAAALLRLCVQLLCRELGEPGKNINDDIAALVSKGLDVRVQQALDIVRVVGNNAVHPGQIDLDDEKETAHSLFQLINVIVEKMISEPKHIDAVFASLPEDTRKAIEARSKKKS